MEITDLDPPLVVAAPEPSGSVHTESSYVVVEPGQMPEFEKRLERLNKKAAKFGLPPIQVVSNRRTLYERQSEQVGRDGDRIATALVRVPDGATAREPVFMQRIMLNYPEVRLGNWQVVGRVEAMKAGNLMFAVTQRADDVEAVRNAAAHPIDCEHCKVQRKRKEGFVLRDVADGSYKRVGSTCLEDFTGIDPAAALFLAKMYEVVRVTEGEMMDFAGSGRANAVETRDYLTRVAYLIANHGFIGAQRAREEMVSATFDDAIGLGELLRESRSEMDRYINSLETHQATADAVRAWYAGRPADSDFERNVQLILAEEGIALDRRHLALAAAAVSMYGRHLQVQAEQSRPSSYVGQVGEKLGRLLTIQRIVVVHNIFRHADDHLILFRDQDGNQVKWKTSAATREMLDGVGKTMEATFKVKEHGDYKGVAQTTVTHLKALRWVDSEAEVRNSLVDAAAQDVATVESVRSAIADVVRLDLQELGEGVGRVVVSTSADLQRAHFTRWFDGSCVADEAGEPLMVFHGTGNLEGLSEFDPAMTGQGNDQLGSGFYFTTNSDEASGYATAVTGNAGPGARKLGGDESPGVVPVYLAIKNPIWVKSSNLTHSDVELTHRQAVEIIKRAPNIRDLDESPMGDHVDIWSAGAVTDKMISTVAKLYEGPSLISLENDFFRGDATAFRHALHEVTGRDGVVFEFENGHKHFVAWFPEQIKSAIGNRGTYDPRDPDIRHSLAAGAAGLDPRAQAFHDVATNTTVFLADRIPAGKEASVFLHETVHRHGCQALPEGRWGALVGQVKAWAQAEPQSAERAIHDAAAARVATAGVAGAVADEELFAYAVEEAVAMGIEPTAAAVEGSAEAWLQVVVESIQRVTDKLLGNDLQALGGQDLVDLAYALAQLDSPEHGLDVRRALAAIREGGPEKLSFRIESRDGPSGQSNLSLVASANGAEAGRVDYSVYRDVPQIQFISVPEACRRNGIATALVMRLQDEYPGTEVDWGMLTEDGAKLHASIPKQFFPNPEYSKKADELLRVEQQLQTYSKLDAEFGAITSPTESQRASFLAAVSDWNDLHDAKDELEDYLRVTPSGKTLLLRDDGISPVKNNQLECGIER